MSIDIERLKIDPAYWDAVAPEGATHWDDDEFLRWTDTICSGMRSLDVWDCGAWTVDAYGFNGDLLEFVGQGAIARPAVSPASLITDERAAEIGETGIPVSEKPKLDQSVFDGLPVNYQWAAIDHDGSACGYLGKPVCKSFGWVNQITPIGGSYDAAGWQNSLIERQSTTTEITQAVDFVEPVQAVAVENLPEGQRPYSHYFKDVSDVDAIDLYHVAKLYEINDPCLFHAFKKIACAGKRGAKDQAQDVQEAIDALKRWQELNK